MFKEIQKNKKLFFLSILCIFILFCFVNANFSLAVESSSASTVGKTALGGVGKAVTIVFGWIAYSIAYVVGQIAVLVIKVLVDIAQINNIIGVEAVEVGWKIIRDLCNMFFILILLVIAFATILKVENYSVKKLLPKLLIMAVLINFSKTICGLIIDFGQVIMLTFVNGFGEYGANNFINLFKVDKYLAISNSWDSNVGFMETLGGIVGGLLAFIITLIVVVVTLGVLVMRLIMLWVYTILSPVAFLASAFPAGQKYASQWWGEFSKQVVVGPVLAFFLWLALKTADKSVSSQMDGVTNYANTLSGGVSTILSSSDFTTYIITIGLLVGGLMVAQQMGGAAGSIAGKGLDWAKGVGRGLGKGSLAGLDWINRKQAAAGVTPWDLNPFRQKERIKASLDRLKNDDLSDMDTKASARLRKGGWTGAIGGFTATGWGDQHIRGFLGYKGLMSAVRGSEDNVKEWRKDEEENKWKSENAGDNYTKNLRQAIHGKINAKATGDDNAVQEYTKEILKLNKYKKDLTSHDAEYFVKKQNKARRLADKYGVVDYESKKARRAKENEERSKITSKNEDELIAQFGNALSHNNKSLAGALARAIAEVGGGNALLKKYGYNVTAGLTEKEAKGMSKEDVLKNRGFNDFMRDIFGKQLGLDEQSVLALQSDLGGIGETIGHDYLIKTVGVNSQGNFYQSDKKERERVKTEEKLKREPEGVIRKNNRLEYGAENIYTGDFEWSDAGLATFITNIDMVNKEVEGKRFNRSAAKAVTETKALAKLEQKLNEVGITEIQTKDPKNPILVKNFIKTLKAYGEQASKDKLGKLLPK